MSASISCPVVRIHGRFFWKGDDRVKPPSSSLDATGSNTSDKVLVKGVAYQVRSTLDPISDDRLVELREDILLFKGLGLNTLFVCRRGAKYSHDKADSFVKIALTIQKIMRRP